MCLNKWTRAVWGGLVIVAAVLGIDRHANGGVPEQKENLALPTISVANEIERSEPDSISLYGQLLEGDGLFFIVGRSGGSISVAEFAEVKEEILRAIAQISSDVQFLVLFFDSGILQFPSSGRPVVASLQAKDSVRAWLRYVSRGLGTCQAEALQHVESLARRASLQRNAIILVPLAALASRVISVSHARHRSELLVLRE